MASILLLSCTAERTKAKPSQDIQDYGTASLDLSTPEATAHSMMMAMYRGEADLIDQIFVDGGELNRAKVDGTVEFGARQRWQDWVGLEPGEAHEEIFDLKVEQFGNLATVWAPFVISINGKIAGCGVNQLSLVNQRDDTTPKWRIVSAIDTQAPKDTCAEFREVKITTNHLGPR